MVLIGNNEVVIDGRHAWMGHTKEFYYEPDEAEELSTTVGTAVTNAHDEDILDQTWRRGEDVATDALDGLCEEHDLKRTLQFEADPTTTPIIADESGNPVITIVSH